MKVLLYEPVVGSSDHHLTRSVYANDPPKKSSFICTFCCINSCTSTRDHYNKRQQQREMMMTTKIYQFHLTQEDKDLLNEKGWGASDRTLAYADKGMGTIDLNQWFDAYDHVATVDSTDLDEVFRLTNLWEKPELVQKHAQMTSVSVGDVLEIDGQFYLVANCGFETVNLNKAA